MLKLAGAYFVNIQSIRDAHYVFGKGLNIIMTEPFQNNVGKSILFKCLRVLENHPIYNSKLLNELINENADEAVFYLEAEDGSLAGFRLTRDSGKVDYFEKKADEIESNWLSDYPEEFLLSIGFMIHEKTKFTLNIGDSVTGKILDNMSASALYSAVELITNSEELNNLQDKVDVELEVYKQNLKRLKEYTDIFRKKKEKVKPEDINKLQVRLNKLNSITELLEIIHSIDENLGSIKTVPSLHLKKRKAEIANFLETVLNTQEELKKVTVVSQPKDISKILELLEILIRCKEELNKISIVNSENISMKGKIISNLEIISELGNYIEVIERTNKDLKVSEKNVKDILEKNSDLLEAVNCPIKGEVIFFEDGCVAQ